MASCFLFTTEKTEIHNNFQTQIKEEYKTVLFKILLIFFEWIYCGQMNVCFDFFMKKTLGQFEARVYSSF